MLLEKEVSKASIAKIVGISRTALHHFIRTRKLDRWAQMADHKGSVLRAYFYSNLGGTLTQRFSLCLIHSNRRGTRPICPAWEGLPIRQSVLF